MDTEELKRFMIELINEEFGPKPVAIGKRWQGGKMVLEPGNDSQAKDIPLDVFFKKLSGVRDNLRVLEQKINGCDALSLEEKVTFQAYITKSYGSLTTFNILFRDDKDKFVGMSGSGGKGDKDEPQMTMKEAKERLGFKEYGK
jgi:hypothetical protein